jgi:hypothetical protein
MEQIGQVWQGTGGDDGHIYLVMDRDGEVFQFVRGDFYQAITRFAKKGANIKDIQNPTGVFVRD